MRKILYVTGTRADYGLMRNTLTEINGNPKLKLSVVATGMHLLKEFGNTILDVKKDSKQHGFNFIESKTTYEDDTKESMSEFVGNFTSELTGICKDVKPDVMLVLGDRGEMLAGAIVGAYLGIPVAHIHGGDVSSTVDDIVRHAITKLSSIHFAASQSSADRIIKMGEEKKRVFNVGAPGLDTITKDLLPQEYIMNKIGVRKNQKYIILVQHPVSIEANDSEKNITESLEAIARMKIPTLVIYPNADAGGRKMIEVIKKYESYPFIKSYSNINHKEFLSMVKYSSGVIGNSSAGIIEVASFKKPVINIGTRQSGRERTFNVIDTDYDRDEIYDAIRKILYDKKFINLLRHCKNPYGEGNAGKRISKILSEIKIDNKLIQKRLNY